MAEPPASDENPDQAPRTADQDRGSSTGKTVLFTAVMILVTLGMGEGLTRVFYARSLTDFEVARQRLAGEPVPDVQYCLTQPYLLYAPLPGFSQAGKIQHNQQGYRGKAVPMRRTPGIARVLCLGGSTTYGWHNPDPDGTYPAHLERILASNLPPGVEGVEVINGGLPYGTTAELLTHYHFKFHFYRPDLVIINTGGNDTHPMMSEYYQPDYSHWRGQPALPVELPRHSRWLMRSRLASLFAIAFFYGDAPNPTGTLSRPADSPPPVAWYPDAKRDPDRDIPKEELAFAHNLKTLVEMIQRDGARVLLVPFRAAPANRYPESELEALATNEALLLEAAAEYGIEVAPFPTEVISSDYWFDDCHENALGSEQKAAHIASYARRVLWP